MGTRGLGKLSVKGARRVPFPPANNIASIIVPLDYQKIRPLASRISTKYGDYFAINITSAAAIAMFFWNMIMLVILA